MFEATLLASRRIGSALDDRAERFEVADVFGEEDAVGAKASYVVVRHGCPPRRLRLQTICRAAGSQENGA